MKKWRSLLGLLIVLQVLSTALYLGKAGGPGFPLDDAWIHQTYARNLGLYGTMAFSPGQPSTGSTSFGWTLLLAIGYFFRIPFFLWTYLLGGIFAVTTAYIAACLSQIYSDDFRNAWTVGILCILEWHLAWASMSGMEIGLFTSSILLFFLFLHKNTRPLLLGGLVGLTVLIRPEGIILILVYGLKLLLDHPLSYKNIFRNLSFFLLAFLVVVSPWILFNLAYSHRPFPNTISAKFMVYGYPWSLGKSLTYLWKVFIYFLDGPLLLLIPAAALTVYKAWRAKNKFLLYPLTWFATLIGLYAVALPAIYDQGRYLMPLIPLFVIAGVEGFGQILARLKLSAFLRSGSWLLLFGMVCLLWINGASDFAYRIQLFNTVHMKAAEWINTNTSPDTIIATHDIGILGYYTQRPIVDLAGLITPEIVPIMNNPPRLAEYLRAKHVTYLIVYSGYYREVLDVLHAQRVFSPGAQQLRAMGVEPFEIYKISKQ